MVTHCQVFYVFVDEISCFKEEQYDKGVSWFMTL